MTSTMTSMPCPHDDRIRLHCHNSIAPELENMHFADATSRPYVPAHTTPRLDVAYPHNPVPLFEPPSGHGTLGPARSMPQFHLLSSVGNEPPDGTPTGCRDLCYSQPFETYNHWGSYHASPSLLLNATYVASPPTFRHSMSEPILHPTSCRQPLWTAENNPTNFVDEFPQASPSNYLPTDPPLHNTGPSTPHSNFTSQPYGGTLDTSHSCLWTEGGVICNIMVQATRSQMNRHLHAYHGFGGSDTRQTRCYWAGCGEMMQQGSIARHMVTCHLQAKVTCPTCSKKLSRQDVISKHQRVCPAAGTWR